MVKGMVGQVLWMNPFLYQLRCKLAAMSALRKVKGGKLEGKQEASWLGRDTNSRKRPKNMLEVTTTLKYVDLVSLVTVVFGLFTIF